MHDKIKYLGLLVGLFTHDVIDINSLKIILTAEIIGYDAKHWILMKETLKLGQHCQKYNFVLFSGKLPYILTHDYMYLPEESALMV